MSPAASKPISRHGPQAHACFTFMGVSRFQETFQGLGEVARFAAPPSYRRPRPSMAWLCPVSAFIG
jgi:hypothetical protein